jgi:hypothetical protein
MHILRHRIPTASLPVGSPESQYFRQTRASGSDVAHIAICWPRAFAAWSDDTNNFFTIGHSTRTIVEFVDLLRESGVSLVVDVRSIPWSRTNPQFNKETLPETLEPWQIGYEHIAELGGRRGKSHDAESSPNTYWRVRSFRNYADYALTVPFAVGLARLRERGGQQDV